MSEFAQVLRDRLNKLEEAHARQLADLNDEHAGRVSKLNAKHEMHREALLTAIYCETGEGDPGLAASLRAVDATIRASRPSQYRNQMDAVKAAIAACVLVGDGTFTKNDVRAKLKEIQPDVSEYVMKNMASFLWRLHKDENWITVKEKGQGHRQSVYVVAKKEPTLEGEGS